MSSETEQPDAGSGVLSGFTAEEWAEAYRQAHSILRNNKSKVRALRLVEQRLLEMRKPSDEKTQPQHCLPAAAPFRELTPDVFKLLLFGLRMHLNGGDKHSASITGNDEYGLTRTRKTNGSPDYIITEDVLEVDGNPEIRLDMTSGERDIEGFCRAYNEWRRANPGADRRSSTEIAVEAMLEAAERAAAERVARMPDEQSAIQTMWDAYRRLEELGWRNAIYCPKDGTMFKVIEPGSTGIYDCLYRGVWPNGSWWVMWEGDMGLARPILFKPAEKTEQSGSNS